ncbi:thermonuclease family protein [Nitrosospira multiformis]|uniref:thermonuclease family protein n=1 Tax=Nitrosospira multiformis TaxID=1231 RepID=UPI0020C8A8F8|nr:thermonuclease family protein [Nitrosospira multiformis]
MAVYILCTCLAHAEILRGRVVKIADGDTVTVLDESKHQHKVSLIGIDAPERKQPFRTVSRQNLADLVFGKEVAVEWHKQDRYQRVLGKVLLNGQDVNLKQIKAGLAWHYAQYDKDLRLADKRLYAEAQKSQPVSRALGCGVIRYQSHLAQDRWQNNVRYSLIVSIEVPDESVDIYSVIESIIPAQVQVVWDKDFIPLQDDLAKSFR